MQRVKNLLKNKKVLWGLVGLVVLFFIISSFFKNGNGTYEVVIVERRDLVEEVRVSGTVEAKTVADIGFEASGVVQSVFVDVNDTVMPGQTLAQLSLGTLVAELQSAQAALAIKRAEVANTGINIDAIKQKHDTFVMNAYSELLSNGLIAEPQSPTYDQTAPIITGRYNGAEGTYKIQVKSGGSGSNDLYVFGLESTGAVEINDTGATPLGTRGLYITFVDSIHEYTNTTWYVTLPNTKNSTYAADYSTWQDTVRERERALDDAEAQLRAQESGTSIAEAELAQAQAEVARIQAQIAQRVITAPFEAVVAAVHIDLGESVSAAEPALSLISNDGFGVEIDLPEIDSVKVTPGDLAVITLDVFGAGEPFLGTIATVNRAETMIDNVAVYEARVSFNEQDERITSGMTAEVAITTNSKSDALAVPVRAVNYREDGQTYVLVEDTTTGEPKEVDIVTGLRSSDSFFEVVAGLSVGDRVLIAS